MDPEIIALFEQHRELQEQVKKQQAAMLEIRRQISIRIAGYGLLVIPYFSDWDKWKQR